MNTNYCVVFAFESLKILTIIAVSVLSSIVLLSYDVCTSFFPLCFCLGLVSRRLSHVF